jgi:acetyltransferase-like isoleucine patch superfamily enzyme
VIGLEGATGLRRFTEQATGGLHLKYTAYLRYLSARFTALSPFSRRRKRPWPPSRAIVHTRDLLKGPAFEIGDYTYGLPTVFPGAGAKLRIGKYCSIADEVVIDLGWAHRTDLATTYPLWAFPDYWPKVRELKHQDVVFMPRSDVTIGNDVWIGRQALILSAVCIGDGTIIGARSVVTKDVEPYSIVAGNPARLIRMRFDDKTIERLLQIRWWDWPVEKVNENIHLICSSNLEGLLSLE